MASVRRQSPSASLTLPGLSADDLEARERPARRRGRSETPAERTPREAPLQQGLFAAGSPTVDAHAVFERRALDDTSWIDVARGFLHGADTLFDVLRTEVPWMQGRRWMYDRMVDDPRLSHWYGADEALPNAALVAVQRALAARYRVPFAGVGLNYYRDGRDSVALHRDRELRSLDDTLVAILTLGAQRPFLIRPRDGGPSIDLAPASGDLLVMGGAFQQVFEHGVPKVAHAGPRISASYRWSSLAGTSS